MSQIDHPFRSIINKSRAPISLSPPLLSPLSLSFFYLHPLSFRVRKTTAAQRDFYLRKVPRLVRVDRRDEREKRASVSGRCDDATACNCLRVCRLQGYTREYISILSPIALSSLSFLQPTAEVFVLSFMRRFLKKGTLFRTSLRDKLLVYLVQTKNSPPPPQTLFTNRRLRIKMPRVQNGDECIPRFYVQSP